MGCTVGATMNLLRYIVRSTVKSKILGLPLTGLYVTVPKEARGGLDIRIDTPLPHLSTCPATGSRLFMLVELYDQSGNSFKFQPSSPSIPSAAPKRRGRSSTRTGPGDSDTRGWLHARQSGNGNTVNSESESSGSPVRSSWFDLMWCLLVWAVERERGAKNSLGFRPVCRG